MHLFVCVCMCSDIQALQRNVSSETTTVVKSTPSKQDPLCDKPPLDNGQYLDIRGVTETDSPLDVNATKTSTTTTTTTTDCTESTTTATQPHSKLKSQSQQSKTAVLFDQPNRWDLHFLVDCPMTVKKEFMRCTRADKVLKQVTTKFYQKWDLFQNLVSFLTKVGHIFGIIATLLMWKLFQTLCRKLVVIMLGSSTKILSSSGKSI